MSVVHVNVPPIEMLLDATPVKFPSKFIDVAFNNPILPIVDTVRFAHVTLLEDMLLLHIRPDNVKDAAPIAPPIVRDEVACPTKFCVTFKVVTFITLTPVIDNCLKLYCDGVTSRIVILDINKEKVVLGALTTSAVTVVIIKFE